MAVNIFGQIQKALEAAVDNTSRDFTFTDVTEEQAITIHAILLAALRKVVFELWQAIGRNNINLQQFEFAKSLADLDAKGPQAILQSIPLDFNAATQTAVVKHPAGNVLALKEAVRGIYNDIFKNNKINKIAVREGEECYAWAVPDGDTLELVYNILEGLQSSHGYAPATLTSLENNPPLVMIPSRVLDNIARSEKLEIERTRDGGGGDLPSL